MNKLIRDSPVRPGVAQFGSALEWGSRGREFDSRHSDQTVGCASAKERQIRKGLAFFIYIFLGAVLCSSNGFLTDIIFPIGNIMRKKINRKRKTTRK